MQKHPRGRDAQDEIPFPQHHLDRRFVNDAGRVVNEDVHAAKVLDRQLDHGFGRRLAGHVRHERDHLFVVPENLVERNERPGLHRHDRSEQLLW